MNMISNFHSMALPVHILQALDSMDYVTPTPIQAQTIPIALQNNDILGSAQTGTGKTLAFVIPLITKLLNNPNSSALILTPTRELAQQVINVVKKIMGPKSPIRSVLLIGGESFFNQLKQLKFGPRIIVGTPGRIIDHFSRKTLKPNFNFLVLDETDRMFDMGFGIQLEKIISQLPKERQTLMFSATLPPKIERLAAKYLIKPKRIAMNSSSAVISFDKLKEESIKVKESEKYAKLLLQLQKREGSIIIFVKTKSGADRLSDNLRKENHSSSAMHGDLKQSARTRIMNDFRNGRYKIMVATDLAARGLDVPHIQHVINYDLPNCPEDYIHRVGRTARAGADGCALNLISNHDQSKWDDIQRFISPDKFPDKFPERRRTSEKPRSSRTSGKSSGKYNFSEPRENNTRPDQKRKAKKFSFHGRKEFEVSKGTGTGRRGSSGKARSLTTV